MILPGQVYRTDREILEKYGSVLYKGQHFEVLNINPHIDEISVGCYEENKVYYLPSAAIISFCTFISPYSQRPPIKVPNHVTTQGLADLSISRIGNSASQSHSESAIKKCECGSHSIRYDIHSTWCQLYTKAN